MISIIDAGVGNVRSVHNMLHSIGYESAIVRDPRLLRPGEPVILPGVGAFDHGMKKLKKSGFLDVLVEPDFVAGTPVLGVCLGMHLLARSSEEGSEAGLGLFDGDVVSMDAMGESGPVRIPHMGWTEVSPRRGSVLLSGFEETPRFYFCHSFRYAPGPRSRVAGVARHGREFPAVVEDGKLFGVQFHPEKSHRFGMQVLRNFAHAAGLCREYE